MQIDSWLIFTSIALAATATPGPAALLISTHSLRFGPVRSLATIGGNVTGLFLMSLASVLGLSAVMLASSTAFLALKMAGALYLVYLGLKLWSKQSEAEADRYPRPQKHGALGLFLHGLLIALTNPKAILFTTALFPQFVLPSEPLAPQFVVLVATLMTLSFACLLSYAIATHRTKNKFVSLRWNKNLARGLGTLYIGAGALLATTSR